jgi:hypothetical protein
MSLSILEIFLDKLNEVETRFCTACNNLKKDTLVGMVRDM